MKYRHLAASLSVLAGAALSFCAFAAGSGELQGPTPPQPLPSGIAPLTPDTTTPARPLNDAGATVELTAVEFSGNKALSSEQLQRAVGELTGRRLSLAELDALAQRVAAAYRAAGYPFVRAWLPPQRIRDGLLHIEVLEGTLGTARAVGTDPKAADAQPWIDAGLQRGAIIDERTLERSMLLLNDQPGFAVHPSLRPGAERGESDLEVQVQRTSRVSGELALDNAGAESTGRYRARADLQVNSPFVFGDRLAFSVMATDEDMRLGSLSYEAPLNHHGLRGQLAFSRTSYQLAGAFSALDASGVANTASARLGHALLRSQKANLVASLTLQHKALEDRYLGDALRVPKSSNAAVAGLQFDHRDLAGGGGVTYGLVSLTAGSLHLDAAAQAGDAATARTQGRFAKLNLDVARIQQLGGAFSAYARFSGQLASKNLDASEKFGIGGSLGLRAYPMGEGTGDNAWLSQLELRYAAAPATLFGFVDAGQAFVNARPWDDASHGRRSLAGAGVGVRWYRGPWSVESTVAQRVHGGPATSESRDRQPRWFVVGSYRF